MWARGVCTSWLSKIAGSGKVHLSWLSVSASFAAGLKATVASPKFPGVLGLWSCWVISHAVVSCGVPPMCNGHNIRDSRDGRGRQVCGWAVVHGCRLKDYGLPSKASKPCMDRVHGCHHAMKSERPVSKGTLVEMDQMSVYHPNKLWMGSIGPVEAEPLHF